MDDSQSKELIERFYSMLHYQLMAKLPKKDGVHIYATDRLIKSVKTNFYDEGIEIVIGEGLDYAQFVLGYDSEGYHNRTARIPKPTKDNPNPTHLEAMNFKIIEECIVEVAKALGEIGGITVNGNPI